MSSLLRSSRLLQCRTIPVSRFVSRRQAAPAFSTSVSRFAGKESAVHEDAEKQGAEMEKQKQDQLQKAQKTGEGEFKDDLASDGESAVKADRHEYEDSHDDIKKMQKETEDKPREKHGQ